MALFTFGSAVGFVNDGVGKEIDSKAMRKVEEGQDLIGVVESSSVSQGVIASVYIRTLIKLH